MVCDPRCCSHDSRLIAPARPDVNHDMSKTRLAKDGTPIQAPKGKELKGDLERISTQKAEGYCESDGSGPKPSVRELTTGLA